MRRSNKTSKNSIKLPVQCTLSLLDHKILNSVGNRPKAKDHSRKKTRALDPNWICDVSWLSSKEEVLHEFMPFQLQYCCYIHRKNNEGLT
jgi:hypothetical protein